MSFSSGNLAANWKLFRAQLDIYMVAKKFDKMSEDEKIANALVLMGSDCVPIYEQFSFDEGVENKMKTLANVLAMFADHCEPVKNTIYERAKFNSLKQGDMSIHQFITSLQSQADLCEYNTMRDELVRDRIVVGVNDAKLREFLINVDNLTLSSCIQKAKQYTSHQDQMRKVELPSQDDNVDSVGAPRSRNHKTQGINKRTGFVKTCAFCNKEPHNRDKCPARFSVCHSCKQKGHWSKARVCRGRQRKETTNQSDEVTQNEYTEEENVEGLYLGDYE